jgi:hypothetical protein
VLLALFADWIGSGAAATPSMTLGGKTEGALWANANAVASVNVKITAALVIRSLRMIPPVTPTFVGESRCESCSATRALSRKAHALWGAVH